MIGFLIGIATAAVLSVVMLLGMQTLFIPTESLYDGPNLELGEHLIDQTVGGDVDTE